ncbi:ATP-dependent DNA helicase [Asticcacaulis biprosthecium C19]|uniref:ATP-dependent DNA helicase n=1 Tax=Asticcacaulis biprosthecium C19 TaxID=715226 RepID=F4QGP2_9CAUL|nr:ATP-dependent DNA helicase [Asticcacaulis biprosthecium]EGF92494.1 ATP-dependent DNA helicase [Asticcacaulis biprosthecium C19]
MSDPSSQSNATPAWRDLTPTHALGLTPARAFVVGPEGGRIVGVPELRELWGREALIVANAPLMRNRLFGNRQAREARHFDVLELYAFIRPAQFCAPSAAGLALACGHTEPETPDDQARILVQVILDLCEDLRASPLGFRLAAQSGVKLMERQGWVWAPLVQAVLDHTDLPADYVAPPALDIWSLLEEWEDQPPEGQARAVAMSEEEVTLHLGRGLQRAGLDERRPEQLDFALKAREIFAPKWMKDQPNMWLLEAGTGVGKTLGYLAPAHAWAERAQGQVWISTYTKALQKQIHHDTRALFDSPAERADKVVVRKGRENYLCLLNFQERLAAMHSAPELIMAVLMARWALYSRDGDIISGDFPTWLPSLLPPGTPAQVFGSLTPQSLVDRRGECTYAACPHYRVCFIEKSVRKAKSASLVIANHALVMAQAAYDLRDTARSQMQAEMNGEDVPADADAPALSRLVFDEGHHLFEAADSAFATRLSGLEAYELRRWIRGNEGRSRRGRGLEARLGDLIAGQEAAQTAMKELIRAAHVLPSDGFSQRLGVRTQSGGGLEPIGPIEALLVQVYNQIDIRQGEARLRSKFSPDAEQGGECEAHPCIEGVAVAAKMAARALAGIEAPLLALVRALEDRLNEGAELEPADRIRIDGALRGLERRARLLLPAWRSLLQQLALEEGDIVEDDGTPHTIDWFSTEVLRGKVVDVTLNRHYVDPSLPLAEFVLKPAHGVLVASATLSDGAADSETDRFALAKQRTGANHLVMGAKTARITSPFDYARQARLFVITDVSREDPRAVGAAMEALFKASKGGGLGLFTAIRRLKAVYEQINRPLSEAGVSLYAQHVDPLDVSDLISVFRSEHHSCLLGTDAVRDGIDVPGQALRLIAFDRIPWPRPDCLHRARRQHFGNKIYDDALTRAKLAQAFGRLIRKADDRGVFVMLDSAAPTRLFTGLPEGVVVQRCTLAEALDSVGRFLHGEPKVAAADAK